jgi:hypothetical protein
MLLTLKFKSILILKGRSVSERLHYILNLHLIWSHAMSCHVSIIQAIDRSLRPCPYQVVLMNILDGGARGAMKVA